MTSIFFWCFKRLGFFCFLTFSEFFCDILSHLWLGSQVVSMLDSGTEGPGFKSQLRCCLVTSSVIEYGLPLSFYGFVIVCIDQ